MKLQKLAGATSEIWQIFIADSSSTTGGGLTGLVFNTAGLTAYYHRDTDTTATVMTLVTMTVGTFTSLGFKEIDATNMPGWYQLCPPNAALASGAKSCGFLLKGATNMAPLPIEVQLTAVNPDSASAFVTGVNVTAINSVSTSSVTTINANQGTTQPLNFTGTAGSALVKSDMVDIAGAAVSTTTAQIGVNTVQLNAQTVTAAAGVTFPSSVASPTNITAGTITTVTNLTNAPTAGDFTATMKTSIGTAVAASAVASVTAAVSITGDLTSTMKTSVENAVWNAALSSHTTTGSAGAGLSSASSAGDPWSTALPGAYASGTAGNIVGNNLNATVTSRMATYTQPTGFLAATFPTTVASPTNITAGTITTVTNLTNAPTAGDFTSTMKTSIGTAVAASAVASVTGNVGGNVNGNVVGSVGSVTAGVALTSSERTSVADAILDRDMSLGTDSGSSSVRTPRQALRALRNKNSAVAGIVYKEDDTTPSWSYTVTTDAAADPITVLDPA